MSVVDTAMGCLISLQGRTAARRQEVWSADCPQPTAPVRAESHLAKVEPAWNGLP